MSEIERAARAWARYKRDAVGTPAGFELDLLRAIESTPPKPVVTLTVEEAGHRHFGVPMVERGCKTCDAIRERIAKAREAGS